MNYCPKPLSFCRRCLYSSAHPLGLVLDEEGICSGCRTHEEKDSLDWAERWNQLESLVNPYRCKSGRNYDCIVPVTGANDSYFIVHLVKDRLKLNPLLVTYNKYSNTPLGIRNLARLRSCFDCDILVQNVNPLSVKKIVRTTLRQYGNLYWHCIAGQTVFPVQTAVRFRVPLIVWGGHQGLEQVGMFSHEHAVQMTRRYRKDHDLFSVEADDLLSDFDVLNEGDIWQYRYPEDSDLDAVGVTGIYLGNFVRWDPKAQHEEMIRKYDYRTATFPRTFECYDHVDCYNYMGVHDLLKLYKHGYSKVTDHACREIRFGRLSRRQGLRLVRQHEQMEAPYLRQFCDWLGISEASFAFITDRHRNPNFWTEVSPGNWQFSGLSLFADQHADSSGLEPEPPRPDISYQSNSQLSYLFDDDRYIVIGKGYP